MGTGQRERETPESWLKFERRKVFRHRSAVEPSLWVAAIYGGKNDHQVFQRWDLVEHLGPEIVWAGEPRRTIVSLARPAYRLAAQKYCRSLPPPQKDFPGRWQLDLELERDDRYYDGDVGPLKVKSFSTDEATRLLASMLGWGEFTVEATPSTALAKRYLRTAVERGRDWGWEAAEDNFRLAYEALGADYPSEDSTGYDWHIGKHPIQTVVPRAKLAEHSLV